MVGGRAGLLGGGLRTAVGLYSHLLGIDAAGARMWLTELLDYCLTTPDPVETIGILLRGLASSPAPAVFEAAATIRDGASGQIREVIGP